MTLKVISDKYLGDEAARLRFLREARAAASVRHPNVASVFHLGRTGDNYFYAMEFVEGETLEGLIRRSGRLEIKLSLEIAAQVAAAVHKQKLVHRDIKPANIMVSLDDAGAVTAKIIDLGLEKDPARRFQSPAELLKVMPMVRDAIEVGSFLMKTIRVFVFSTGDVQKGADSGGSSDPLGCFPV